MQRGEWELMMIVLNAECDKYSDKKLTRKEYQHKYYLEHTKPKRHKVKLKKKQLKQFDTVINKQDIEKAFKEKENGN